MKCIIPCSGYGTRVGMTPNQSKEMLWDMVNGEYIIDYSLNLCKKLGFDPLVLSRSEKTDLNIYVESNKVEVKIINDGEEWFDTILKSYRYWDDNNIVLLPDTRWDNAEQSLKHIKYCFEKLNTVMALGTLEVPDATKWCVLHGDFLFEKPQSNVSNLAIGVFAFYKEVGKSLFRTFKYKNSFCIPKSTQFVELENFTDITREKSDRLVYDLS